jgi:hypothetical protein
MIHVVHDTVKDQISYLINNREELFPMQIRSMSSDVCAKPFKKRLTLVEAQRLE